MKKIFSTFIMAITFIFMCTGCTAKSSCKINSEIDSEIDFCESILQQGEAFYYSDLGTDEQVKELAKGLSVQKNLDGDTEIYEVKLGEKTLVISVSSEDDTEPTQFLNVEPATLDAEIIQHIKNRVKVFIKNVDFFSDKEELMAFIDQVPFYRADIKGLSAEKSAGEVFAVYDDDTNAVYISNDASNNLFNELAEHLLVHELIHALCTRTNGGDNHKRYEAGFFDEIQTELFTSNLGAYYSERYRTIYAQHLPYALQYYYAVGEKAMKAYFYGYNGDEFSIEFLNELDLFNACMQAGYSGQTLSEEDASKLGIASLLLTKWTNSSK